MIRLQTVKLQIYACLLIPPNSSLHPHPMHSKYFLLILLSIYLMSFSRALNCSDEAFDCGVVGYIGYPFWGGDRPSECGRKGFEIACLQGKIPILKISPLSYIIQELDFSTNTVRVARQDVQDTNCPQPLHNTTIDWELFKYPPNSTDRNLTLYFNCATNIHMQPNAFPCANQTNSNLFKIGDGDGITCNTNIYVPINREDARSLQNPTASSINSLRSALITGFSIQWLNDLRQGSAPFCNANVYSSCISYASLKPDRPVCNATRTTYAECLRKENQGPAPAPSIKVPVPSPAPLHIEDGAAVPSPTPSAKSMPPLLPPQTPNGMPHVPTTEYPLGRHNTTQLNDAAGKNLAKKIALVVPLTVAGMIIASISIHCFLRRRRLVTGMWKHDVEKLLLQQGSLTPKRYTYSDIKKITKSFSHKLGQGGYGSVYKGMLPNGCLVAVKVLMETDSNGEEFINEVASICTTSHVNIVTLLGFCYEGNKRALVYEFMPNSSLDKFLNHNQSAVATMDLEKLYKIAVGIAKGLEYLHTGCTTRIVHFDIKPQNILLDEDFCPKISDFGLAKLYKKKQSLLSVVGTRGTAGYIAPEVFSRNFGGVSHKSDVYSYGMMLLEMAGAKKATPAEAIQSSENYFPDKIYEEVIVEDLMMMEGEGETRKKMFVVGFWCIQTIPSSRPSISKVVEMLEGRISSIQIPPKPFLFSPADLHSHEMLSSSLSAYVETQNSAQY